MSNRNKSRAVKPTVATEDIFGSGGSGGISTALSPQEAIARRNEKRKARSTEKAEQLEKAKNIGNDLFKAGDYDGAIKAYSEAVESFGQNPTLLSNLAAAHLKLEEFDLAEDAATAALKHDPRMIKARFRRGMARKGMFHLKAAMIDFTTIMKQDCTCTEAHTQINAILNLIRELGGGRDDSDEDFDVDASEDEGRLEWPPFDDDAYQSSEDSDSSECQHSGNGFPCKFYNHSGCSRREACRYSHAPDEKSVRDKLGKNVCLYFLLGTCRYGTAKCVYSHDKSYLPSGWWDDEEHVAQARQIFDYAEMETLGLRLVNEFIQNISQQPKSSGRYLSTKREHAAPTAKTSTSEKAPNEPFVMLIVLDGGMEADYERPLLDSIRSRLPLKRADTARTAMEYLASPNLSGVFVSDAGITKRTNSQVVTKLVEFAKAGGSVVIGGSFSTFVRPLHMETFFEKAWGVNWKSGSYHRTTFQLNTSHALAKHNLSLPSSFSMKALHVKGAAPDAAVYTSNYDSEPGESPAVHVSMGKGFLAYIGDVNWEEGSSKLILAMLGLLDSPKAPPSTPAKEHSKPVPTVNRTTKGEKTSHIPMVASESNLKSSKFVMLLSLQKDDFFDDMHAHFLPALRAKIEWMQALTASAALKALASPDLAGIYVTDPGIVKSENQQVLSKVVEYVKSGGSVVIGGLFGTLITPKNMAAFFDKAWGLSWNSGSYYRIKFRRSPTHDTAKTNPSMPQIYHVHALHVRNISPRDALYLPADKSLYKSMLLAPHLYESPAAQIRIGNGYLGYIGDVNMEVDSTNIILAMLGLLDSANLSELVQPVSKPTSLLDQGVSKLASSAKLKPRPFMMVLSFGEDQFFSDIQADLLSTLKDKMEVLVGLSSQRVVDLIASPDLKGILITDAAIARPENAYLLDQLVTFTKSGGTVVIGGTFSGHIKFDEIQPFFKTSWGVPWGNGDYTSTEFTINGKHELAKKTPTLPPTFHMKALHISGITPDTALYVASKCSHIYKPLKKVTQAPVAYTQVGKGYLGYIGDVGLREDHTKIVLAMFGLLN